MKTAVYTMQHNEQWYLPMWIKYYSANFQPQDMYILSHNCSGKTLEILKDAEARGINVLYFNTDEIFNHDWLLDVIHSKQKELLGKYDYVVFTDCDEIIIPTDCTLKEFLENATEDAYRCDGWEIQENVMYPSYGFCKTLISRVPLKYVHGYHTAVPEFPIYKTLPMYHIKRINYEEAWKRNLRLLEEKWDKFAVDNRLSWQNRIPNEEEFKESFYAKGDGIVPVPQEILDKILK